MTPGLVLLAHVDVVLRKGTFPDQKAWSLAAGLSHNFLSTFRSRVTNGEVETITAASVERLAKAAGVSMEWLMGSTPQRTRSRAGGDLDALAQSVVDQIQKHNQACAEGHTLRGVEIWIAADGRVEVRSERLRGFHERTVRGDLADPGSR